MSLWNNLKNLATYKIRNKIYKKMQTVVLFASMNKLNWCQQFLLNNPLIVKKITYQRVCFNVKYPCLTPYMYMSNCAYIANDQENNKIDIALHRKWER